MPPLQSASSLPTTPLVSASTPQPSTTRQLADPTFVASLLSQPPTSASPELPLPSSTLSSSLADHVSTKTKQAILRGEYVEFDLLLPENSSLLTDNELTELSISVGGKQVDLPNPRKKKTHVDSIDKWLSAFAVYCTIFAHLLPSEGGRDVHLPGDHPISPTEIRRICMALLRHQFPWESGWQSFPQLGRT